MIKKKATASRWQGAALALCILPLVHSAARADDSGHTGDGPNSSVTDEAPAAKSQYTLFNPVPDRAMRDMDTDRPNVTNTPHTIDAGHLQIETGLYQASHFHDRSNGANIVTNALTFGHINARLGVLDNLEINATLDSYNIAKSTDYIAGQSTSISGVGDTVIGGKLNLWGDEGSDDPWTSGLAIQPQMKLPTAQSGLGNNHIEGVLGVPFLVNLVDGFHLGLETALSQVRNSNNSSYVTGWQNSASIDRVLIANLDAYLEYASQMTSERHVQPQQSIDVGFTYPLTDNIIVDSGATLGVSRSTPAIAWTSGISVRF